MKFQKFIAIFLILSGLLLTSGCGTLAIQVEPLPGGTRSSPTITKQTPQPSSTASPFSSTETPTNLPKITPPVSSLQLKPGTPVKIVAIKMLDEQDGWGVGEVDSDLFQHILFTNDGGNRWQDRTPLAALTNSPSSGLVANAYFGSSSNAWVSYTDRQPTGGQSESVVWYTTDGGTSWEKSKPLDFGEIPMEFRDPSDLGFIDSTFGWIMIHLGAGMSNDYIAIFTSTDGGKTWQRVLDPNQNPDMMGCVKSGLTYTTRNSGWLATDCPGLMPKLVFYHTSDGGATWEDTSLPVPPGKPAEYYAQSGIGCGVPGFDFSIARSLMLTLQCTNYDNSTVQAWLYTTSDSGINWAQYPLPLPYHKINMLNSSEGFMVGSSTTDPTANGAVYHTIDGGNNWSLQTSTAWTGAPDFVNATTGWVIAVHDQVTAFVRSADGGKSWAELKPVIGP